MIIKMLGKHKSLQGKKKKDYSNWESQGKVNESTESKVAIKG